MTPQEAPSTDTPAGRPGLIVFDSISGAAYHAYALAPVGVDATAARDAVATRIDQARERFAGAPAGEEPDFDWNWADFAGWCTEAGLVPLGDITHGPQWD